MDKNDAMRTFNGTIYIKEEDFMRLLESQILNGCSNIRAVNFNGKVYVEREDLMYYLDSLRNTFGTSNKSVDDILTIVECYVSLMDKEKRWDNEDQNK